MEKPNRRQIILIVILLVVAVYYIIDSGLFSSAAPARLPSDAAQAETPTGAGKGRVEDIRKYTRVASILELQWPDSWNRDPFFYASSNTLPDAESGGFVDRIFGSSSPERTSQFKLTGISWVGNSGFALINENVVKEGDTIGGFRVEQVAFSYVILRQGSAESIRLTISR